jgi:urease accessory protein
MTNGEISPGSDTPLRVGSILGCATEGAWPGRLARATVDLLHLDQAEALKSRLRKTTDAGLEVAISLDRGVQLRDGDILRWDQASRTAIVARVDLGEVLVIDIGALLDGPRAVSLARCVELGHALGNQHWPAVVKGTQVYVPLMVSRPVMASVMKTHSLADVRYWFAPGAQIITRLTPGEARRLLGATGGHSHRPVSEQSGPVQ